MPPVNQNQQAPAGQNMPQTPAPIATEPQTSSGVEQNAPQQTPVVDPVQTQPVGNGSITAQSAVLSQATPTVTIAGAQTLAAVAMSEEELKRQAMLAMEGENGRRQRELEEQHRKEEELRAKLEFEKTQIEAKLHEVSKQKEALELEWIKYNNQKTPLETQVQPIISEEKTAEDEERKTEQDEAVAVSTPGVPIAKIQDIEVKRWTIQERRHHAEEQKWAFQKQIEALKASMDTLGAAYRKILQDEDALKKSIRDAEAALKNLSIPKQS